MDDLQTTIESKEQKYISTPTEYTTKDNRKKLKKLAIFSTIVLIIIFISLSFYIYQIKNHIIPKRNDFSTQKIDELIKKDIIEKSKTIERETKLMSFVRDGDIWIANINGSNEEKITSHPILKIKSRHFYGGQWITTDYSNEFYQLPKISPDGRFLVYLGINESIFEEIKDYESKFATESAELKNSGNSIAFHPPGISYSLNVYDLEIKSPIEPEIDVKIKENKDKLREVLNGPFGSMEWSNQSLIYSFIAGLNSYVIKITNLPNDNPMATIMQAGENTCGLTCGISLADYSNDGRSFWVRISPDGQKLLLPKENQYAPSGCANPSYSREVLVINNFSKKIINFSQSDLCYIYIGDWYKDNESFIQMETYANNSRWFVKRNILNPDESPEKLFEDSDFFFNSFISLSPDNKYVIYFSGKYKAENTGRRDLRVRSLETNDFFDVLNITDQQTKLGLDRVSYANWDANSKYIYFKLSENNTSGYAIRFDILNKKAEIILKNVSQLNSN